MLVSRDHQVGTARGVTRSNPSLLRQSLGEPGYTVNIATTFLVL